MTRQIHNPVTMVEGPNVGTITSVNDLDSSVTILAANDARCGASFFNDSTAILYLALSDTTATTSVYTVQLPAGGYYELPWCASGPYRGKVVGIWASNASGAVRVTEFT